MAKRFIDTRMFEDEWFSDLSKDGKMFFIYYITTCDHAGMFKLNRKLCKYQTGVDSPDTVIEELGNSLVRVKEDLFFMPKYILFQYPNFPKSSVKQQESAVKILNSYPSLWEWFIKSYLTVTEGLGKSPLSLSEELPNSYVNVSGNDSACDNAYGSDSGSGVKHLTTLNVTSREEGKPKKEMIARTPSESIMEIFKDKNFEDLDLSEYEPGKYDT